MSKRELTKNEMIERSILTTYRGKIWGPFIKAIKEYELLKPGDKVCVCISGGKDSTLIDKLFQELKRHSDFEFDVKYLVMNPGYNEANLEHVKNNIEMLGIPATFVNTDIFEIANSQDKNPCYLCAKMRRGALYNIAKSMGCNKIALGHHYDDVIETTLMNMLSSGSFQTMLPKLKSTNYEGMELIRPLYYIREIDIIGFTKRFDIDCIRCACRFTEEAADENSETHSRRQDIKELIKQLTKTIPQVEDNLFNAPNNVTLDMILGYKEGGVYHSFLDDYDDEK